MSNITSEELWAAWRSLQDQIDKLRNALHEIEQVSSTILASLPPEISEAGHVTEGSISDKAYRDMQDRVAARLAERQEP